MNLAAFSGTSGRLRLRPENIFLVLGLFFGLFFLFLNPPCGTPDEPVHLMRIFRISQGHFHKAAEVKVPSRDLYCNLCDLVGVMNKPSFMNEAVKDFIKAPNTGSMDIETVFAYPAVPYIPAATAVKLLSLFSPSLAVYLYSARLVTFVISLLITWYAIRLAPAGKWILLALSLMPMRLYQMASISPDSLTASMALLFVVLIMLASSDLAECKSGKKTVLIFFTGILLLFSKPIYVFLLLGLLAVPLKNLKYRRAIIFCAAVLVVIAGFRIYRIASVFQIIPQTTSAQSFNPATQEMVNVEISDLTADQDFLKRVNYRVQTLRLVENPGKIMPVIWNGYKIFGPEILLGTIGNLGWQHVTIPKIALQISILMLLLSVLYNERKVIAIRFRIASIVAFLAMILLIPLALYLANTPVGADYFIGASGRYYIPFLPFLFLAISLPVLNPEKSRLPGMLISLGLATVLAVSIFSLWKTYYENPRTVGYLRLTAQSDSSASVMFSVSREKGVFTGLGRYNIIKSDTPLHYEYRMPEGDLQLASLTIRSLQPINFRIFSVELFSMNGVLIKKIDYSQVQTAKLTSDGSMIFSSPKDMNSIKLDKDINTIFFHGVAIPNNINVNQKEKGNNRGAIPSEGKRE